MGSNQAPRIFSFRALLNFPERTSRVSRIWQSREKFLNVPKDTRHVWRPSSRPSRHTIKSRRNCILCRALLCIMDAPDARIKPGRVFKSARNGTAIIVRNYIRRRVNVPIGGFQRFRYLVSSHTARNVNHLSRCGRFERSGINIFVYNAIIRV